MVERRRRLRHHAPAHQHDGGGDLTALRGRTVTLQLTTVDDGGTNSPVFMFLDYIYMYDAGP